MCAVAGSSHQKEHVLGLSACNDTREFVVAVSDCSVHGVTISSVPFKRLCVHGAEFEHALLVGLFRNTERWRRRLKRILSKVLRSVDLQALLT